jgi:hypothetical protein
MPRDIDKEVADYQGTPSAAPAAASAFASGKTGPYAANFSGGNKIVSKKRGDYSDTGAFAGGVPMKGLHYENGKRK